MRRVKAVSTVKNHDNFTIGFHIIFSIPYWKMQEIQTHCLSDAIRGLNLFIFSCNEIKQC